MSIFWQEKLLFLLISLFISAPVLAQENELKVEYEIQNFGVDDGLSSRFVHCLLQDSRGFLWVGTDYGLNRFDGFSFKTYTQEKDALQSNQISNMLEDAEGNIWLTSSATNRYLEVGTVEIFNPVSEKSTPLEKWVKNPDLLNGELITGIYPN
jgi:ligand-binding sensor domain-containing protein